jgi:hypothetical protein
MTIEATIQTALGALVSGRCYPLVAPDPAVKPYIVYSLISDVQLNSLDGFSGLAEKRVQVDVYTTSYGATKATATACKSAMAIGLPQSIHLSSQDLYEPDTQLYRITMDFSLWSE